MVTSKQRKEKQKQRGQRQADAAKDLSQTVQAMFGDAERLNAEQVQSRLKGMGIARTIYIVRDILDDLKTSGGLEKEYRTDLGQGGYYYYPAFSGF